MATNKKVTSKTGKHTIITLTVILMCFICLIFCAALTSCCEANVSNSSKDQTPATIQISGQQYKIHCRSGNNIYLYTFELEGHMYIANYSPNFIVHSASCPCHNEKSESSSFGLDSSSSFGSSSLFNW